jgi:hypothetical protein
MNDSTCSLVDCDRKYYSKNLCKLHYTRNVRHGDPRTVKYQRRTPSSNAPCIVDGCEKPYETRKMCPQHYQRWRRHGDASLGGSSFPVGCAVDNCTKDHYAHGWCSAHFTRNKRHGSPTYRIQGEVVDGRKICSQCKRDLPVDMYRASSHRKPDELHSHCRTCAKKYIHARRALLAATESDDYKPHEVFARDQWVCQLCNEPINELLKWPHRYSASVDHVLPLSLGGSDTLQNVQSAHLTCNISKGARIPA